MDIFTKIIAFFTSVAVALGGFSLMFKKDIPAPETVEQLVMTDCIFDKPEIADEIYAVNKGRIKTEEYNTVICLQGIVNKVSPQIFIIDNSANEYYLEQLRLSGKTVLREDENGNPWNTVSLIQHFKDYISDGGYVLYRNTELCEGLNTAFNYATLKGWLAVPSELKDLADGCGLRMMKDISNEKYSYDFLLRFFNEHRGEFSDRGIVHLGDWNPQFRDFAVQQNMFLCFSDSTPEGNRFIQKILNGTAEYGYVFGWCLDEKDFVSVISKVGFSIIPSDLYSNSSVLNSFERDISKPAEESRVTPQEGKHYIALVFTDGDNVQTVTNGFGEFFRHLNLHADYTLTWGFPCIADEICQAAEQRFFDAADDSVSFITGPSGIGYAQPSLFEEKSLDAYTTATAASMLKTGSRVITILDDKPNAFKEADFVRRLGYYSRFDNIDGGIIFMDPRMYESGAGKMWFSNGKPFVTVRKTLWSSEGYSGITDEWMKENAAEINSYKSDIGSADGYSVICVHAWSVTPEKLNKFVSLLDDHIEIVSAAQLLNMISENAERNPSSPHC